MFRKFISTLFLLFALGCSLFPVPAHADDNFAVDSSVTYSVEETGKTLVTHNIELENLSSGLYATTYTLTLENIKADKIEARDSNGDQIQKEIKEDGQKLDIKLTFSDSVVGKNEKRHFSISYENGGFAIKTGEVWEISIPRLSDTKSFRDYKINLNVPDSLGSEAYISPKPTVSTDTDGVKHYSFNKEDITQTGVTAGFGQFQVFSFNLSYHLENPLALNSQTEVALPPDTAFQKVYLNKVDPKPFDVHIDSDGNYLAVYKLSPRQRIDVTVEGSVQVFAGFRPFPAPSHTVLQKNLEPTNYWQVNDQNIQAIAANLKTPKEIYDYVTNKLKYNLDRVQPNVVRMGAIEALKNPTQAICMEFTDLFVALARAAGIPAREVNGYAYTENKELQPLSLVADVLHSWPEFYDAENQVWVPIDPTWGSTSGVDYFSKLDLRHFTFVVHGTSDKEPYPPGSYKLGPNPQKDVYVSFGQLPSVRNSIPLISITPLRNIPFLSTVYSVNIVNPGPSSIYTFYPSIYFDADLHSREMVQILPPYGSYSTKITIPYSLLGKNMPDNIKVVVNESHANLSTNKAQVVVNSLIVLFALLIVIVILVLVKLRKIKFDRITATIWSIYAKITRRFNKNSSPTKPQEPPIGLA